MTPTAEQQAIVDFAKTRQENLLISALAGAAKTTTLELICKKVNSIPILSVAFNKKIADEMKTRLPGHVESKTMNGLGHSVWGHKTGQRLVIDMKKSYNLLRAEIDALGRGDKQAAFADFADTLKMISRAKLSGYIPDGAWAEADHLLTREEFEDSFEDPPASLQLRLTDKVLNASIAAAYNGAIDFDDQIYMPTLFGGTFPRFPLVLVDEAQDLSPLNHAMLRRLVSRRVIAVGDPWQSIYGFRGAVSNGMEALRTSFGMSELPLNISFRCPQAVVRRAWFRVPDMRWPDWAAQGSVEELDIWGPRTIPDGAAIICRNNAPLFRCALALIRSGRGVSVVGRDVGPSLVKVLKSLGSPTTGREDVLKLIDQWLQSTLRKNKGKASTYDRAECLRVFAGTANDLAGAIAYAEDLFKREGPIQLLSGHKSKGLEWDTVFHLDPFRVPSPWAKEAEEISQELNIRYVILTRAKQRYVEINMDDFDPVT